MAVDLKDQTIVLRVVNDPSSGDQHLDQGCPLRFSASNAVQTTFTSAIRYLERYSDIYMQCVERPSSLEGEFRKDGINNVFHKFLRSRIDLQLSDTNRFNHLGIPVQRPWCAV
jgi:hypothetical protein